jgi:uracil-DNA glycosylase family 4
MFRGTGRLAMVIGIQPGNTELQSAEAFSGPAGTRLIRWLVQAGVGTDRQDAFERVYFTSLAKCGSAPEDTSRLIRNCRPFLAKQVSIIAPKLLFLLGADPLRGLFPHAKFDHWVCRLFQEDEIQPTLFPLLPAGSRIVSLPHPSPLSRWLNSSENASKLDRALFAAREFLRDADA